jgi:hypothetical protein
MVTDRDIVVGAVAEDAGRPCQIASNEGKSRLKTILIGTRSNSSRASGGAAPPHTISSSEPSINSPTEVSSSGFTPTR